MSGIERSSLSLVLAVVGLIVDGPSSTLRVTHATHMRSINDLRAHPQRLRNCEAECLGGLAIDH